MSTNVFQYGLSNGEEDGVYIISGGGEGSRIMVSVVAADSLAVNRKMLAASEVGRRRKSVCMAQKLCRRCVASPNDRESVGRVGLSERKHVGF